jgi:hypothetical protein
VSSPPKLGEFRASLQFYSLRPRGAEKAGEFDWQSCTMAEFSIFQVIFLASVVQAGFTSWIGLWIRRDMLFKEMGNDKET